MYKRITILAAATTLLGLTTAMAAHAEVCRSISASWSTENFQFRTQMWTSGKDGCKKIAHTIAQNGREDVIEGYDCDCDLSADGQEYRLEGAPHSRNVEQLIALCKGPMADEPYPPMETSSLSDLIS